LKTVGEGIRRRQAACFQKTVPRLDDADDGLYQMENLLEKYLPKQKAMQGKSH
jgi:hypothetical protein